MYFYKKKKINYRYLIIAN